MSLWPSISDIEHGAETLRRRRFGVIEVAGGELRQVVLRPWPKVATFLDVLTGRHFHARRPGDHLRLFYNQPWGHGNFLVLRYVVSQRNTSMRTLTRALDVLDEIARLKRSDALLCDVSNGRIDRRIMARFGWEPHCPSRWHRHYIKRFYGDFPPRAAWLNG